MIIGRGMLALAFSQYANNEDVIIFASGVSNSRETNEKAFEREFNLIKATLSENPDKLFIYFSTCSMYDPHAKETLYVKHKLEIETYIEKNAEKFLILRVSQILGKSKNSTLVNYLVDCIENNKTFELWENSNRNLIALDDVVRISKEFIENSSYYNGTYHIANAHNIDVIDLVKLMETLLSKKASYTVTSRGEKYNPIPNDINTITSKINILMDERYYYNSLKDFIEKNKG